jgi:nitrite reductase/ring-hydroxylating ferredoxin subunit
MTESTVNHDATDAARAATSDPAVVTSEATAAGARRVRAPVGDEVVYQWISRTQEVMVFRFEGTLRACSAICPHMGARLTVDRQRQRIVCPWHDLAFALPECRSEHERYRRLGTFRITERDGHVDVD